MVCQKAACLQREIGCCCTITISNGYTQKAGRLVPRGSDLVALEHSSYDEANVEIAAHTCLEAHGRREVGWSRAPARSQADAPSLVGTKPQVERRRHATVADGAQ